MLKKGKDDDFLNDLFSNFTHSLGMDDPCYDDEEDDNPLLNGFQIEQLIV